jgi:hypothetical protein
VTDRGAATGEVHTICQLTATTTNWLQLMRSNATSDTNDWFKAYQYPALAVNPATNNTSRAKHLYVAYADKGTNANDRGDIFFVQSTNGGVNWSTNAVRVNLDGTTNDQWMPTIAVRPDGNSLFMGWLDRRQDTNNCLIDLYGRWGSIATNGTVSFATNDFRIPTTNFPPAFPGSDTNNLVQGRYDPVWPPEGVSLDWWYPWWHEDPVEGPDLTSGAYVNLAGEHIGAYADANHVYLVWSDNRNGSQATLYPGRKQGDIRLARLPWPP